MKKYNLRNICISLLGIITCALIFIALCPSHMLNFASADTNNFTFEEKIISAPSIEDKFIDDEIIVVLDKKVSQVNKVHNPDFFTGIEIESITDLTRRETNTNVDSNFHQILNIKLKNGTKEKVIEGIKLLEQLEGVHSAEPNFLIEPAIVSNDPYFQSNNQWNLNGIGGINAQYAWNITTGTNKVRVGIIDTGIASHTDLNKNVTDGYDFYNNNTITNDDEFGHGTKVAGIIGAIGNNSEGVSGINWNITMVPMQVSYKADNGVTYFDSNSVVKAINWATNLWGTDKQIDILNYSSSHFGKDEYVRSAIASFPGLFVWSAGNEGLNVDNFNNIEQYSLDNCISVGATDNNNERSVWGSGSSCYGNYVNIYAPGGKGSTNERIFTTSNVNNNYTYFGGTSSAAPHVAGVAALMLSINPNLKSSQIKSLILNSADYVKITIPQNTGGNSIQTVKKLNAHEAVYSVAKDTITGTVTFDKNGGSGGSDYILASRGSVIPEAIAPYRVGYDFNGYYTVSGTQIYDKNMRTSLLWTFEFGTTLYAKWTAHSYTVYVCNAVYDTWEPISVDDTYHFTLNYDEPKTISAPNYNGCTFKFWVFYRTENSDPSNHLNYPIYSNSQTIEIINVSAIDNERFDFVACYDRNACIAENSLITLADGSQKLVQDLTGDEKLLVWNLFTGSFDEASILFIDMEPPKYYEVIKLYFSDGTTTKVINEHAFWDCNLNEYVFIRNDAKKYIGHWFNKISSNDGIDLAGNKVQLLDVIIQNEYTSAWSPVTLNHLCYYVNGMLTAPGGTEGLINIFDVDCDSMKINEEKMQSDIETYGLYTYEEFYEIIPISKSVFDVFNGQYLKVAIGKGLTDIDTLRKLIVRYSKFL